MESLTSHSAGCRSSPSLNGQQLNFQNGTSESPFPDHAIETRDPGTQPSWPSRREDARLPGAENSPASQSDALEIVNSAPSFPLPYSQSRRAQEFHSERVNHSLSPPSVHSSLSRSPSYPTQQQPFHSSPGPIPVSQGLYHGPPTSSQPGNFAYGQHAGYFPQSHAPWIQEQAIPFRSHPESQSRDYSNAPSWYQYENEAYDPSYSRMENPLPFSKQATTRSPGYRHSTTTRAPPSQPTLRPLPSILTDDIDMPAERDMQSGIVMSQYINPHGADTYHLPIRETIHWFELKEDPIFHSIPTDSQTVSKEELIARRTATLKALALRRPVMSEKATQTEFPIEATISGSQRQEHSKGENEIKRDNKKPQTTATSSSETQHEKHHRHSSDTMMIRSKPQSYHRRFPSDTNNVNYYHRDHYYRPPPGDHYRNPRDRDRDRGSVPRSRSPSQQPPKRGRKRPRSAEPETTPARSHVRRALHRTSPSVYR